MLKQINEWIDATNQQFKHQRRSCMEFQQEFKGFYPPEFLCSAYFVVTKDIPKPNFSQLRALGLGAFIDMPVNGITYKNTYYVIPGQQSVARLHFHELVHVVQWAALGSEGFITRYMQEILTLGYDQAPLEIMAYQLDEHYQNGGAPMDIPAYVKSQL